MPVIPPTPEAEGGGWQFEASPGKSQRPYLKNNRAWWHMSIIVVTPEADLGRWWSKASASSYLKNKLKNQKGLGCSLSGRELRKHEI
jgi:hypothetical protein